MAEAEPLSPRSVQLEYRFDRLLSDKLGRVVYRDIDDFKHALNVFSYEYGNCTGGDIHLNERFIFRKNKGYTHEQEVRALIYETYDVTQTLSGTEVFENLRSQRGSEKRTGMSVHVNIPVLIHEIVVSAAFPHWAIRSLQKTVAATFFPALPIEVKPSVLLINP